MAQPTAPDSSTTAFLNSIDIVSCRLCGPSPRKRPRLSNSHAYTQLHRVLQTCLVQRKTNAAAFLVGSRGCGKTHLLETCLSTLDPTTYRRVHLNGMYFAGCDVALVVQEIVRQLSGMALEHSGGERGDSVGSTGRIVHGNDDGVVECNDDDDKSDDDDNDDFAQRHLRFRQTTFGNNLTLLDETLGIASVQGEKPVLLVLDEFDSLLSAGSAPSYSDSSAVTGERQLLFYHLLDKVHAPGASLCVVGMTSQPGAIGSLEKRIRSRLEAGSSVVHVHMPMEYDGLAEALLSHFESNGDTTVDEEQEGHGSTHVDSSIQRLKGAFASLILPPAADKHAGNDGQSNEADRVASTIMNTLRYNYRLGRDFRFFHSVLSCCLAILRRRTQTEGPDKALDGLPTMMLQALTATGSASPDEHSVALNGRMQAILDLPGPQLVLVLAARRILSRDAEKEDEEAIRPLTMQRMVQEYDGSYRGTAHRYSAQVLRSSLMELLTTGVFCPSQDHSEAGPLQYEHAVQKYEELDVGTLERLPLHMPIEIDDELGVLLKNDTLDCPTALKAWGKRKNR